MKIPIFLFIGIIFAAYINYKVGYEIGIEEGYKKGTVDENSRVINDVNRELARYGNIDNLSEIKYKDLEKYYGSSTKGTINDLIKDFKGLQR